YPGAAEVVNMRPPADLIKQGIQALPCIGDGRQSGTSGSPSILNASPEAAAGGGLALVQTGDRLRIDLGRGTADMLVSEDDLADRRRALPAQPFTPESETPWQEIFRDRVGSLADGMTLRGADAFRGTAQKGVPRDNH
ncbi:MAG: dihydroxy-acid dehydratase, partial [Pseudomonadota bacterium]